jgi:hypothetical protein
MTYIPGFKHDIFISYAHVDNLTVGDETGWISGFHRHLEIALAKRIGRMGLVKIWRDEKLEGDQLFDQTISEGLNQSALFLSVASNGYLASEYCIQELKAFHEKARTEPHGLQVGDRSRVYAVLINNIPHSQWPGEFGRISGHPFHNAGDDKDLGNPSDQGEKLFKKQLWELVDSLYQMLQAFQKSSSAAIPDERQDAPAPSKDTGPTVFLADVSDTLRSTRKRLIHDLESKDIRVLTGMPPPYESGAHEDAVKSAAGKSLLSVHLLDQFEGREIDGQADVSYPRKQAEIAQELQVPQLIWVPKDVQVQTVEEEKYRDFLNQLENGVRQEKQYDFVRGSAANLGPQILEKLDQMTRQDPQVGDIKAVLLDTHIKDQLHALELGRYFVENNIQPYINPQEDDPNENIDILESRLKQVNVLVIMYGSVNAAWVRQRLGAALQLSIVEALAINAFCVLAVPPVKQPEELDFNLGPIPIQLIDNSKGALNPELLAPVLAGMRNGGAS